MFNREKYLKRAKRQVKEVSSSTDLILCHCVTTIGELDKCINVLFEKLSEWYGVYFPELRLKEVKDYCNAVIVLDRQNPSQEMLEDAIGAPNAQKAIAQAKSSMGADLKEDDLAQPKKLAENVLSLLVLREQLEAYQNKTAQEICPNTSLIAEPQLAAKLVAQAGSVQKLALMPASTIQVIGASKALFKHLKTGSRPPKHGIIFQHSSISTSPKKVRGKIARALSAKIAMAARADAFSKNLIAPKLKEDFQRRLNELLGR